MMILLAALAAWGTVSAQMQAMFSYSTFYDAADNRPYVETYLLFNAWSLLFEEQPTGGFRATADVTLVLRQQDSVCYYKKYDLNSPVVASPDSLNFKFLDVQRFAVANGLYDLDIYLRDKGAATDAVVTTEKVVVNYDQRKPTLSSVQLMSSVKPTVQTNILSRSGYDMEPYVDDFVPRTVKELLFYYEVYNLDKELGNSSFAAVAYVEQGETGLRLENMQTAVRKKGGPVVAVLSSLNIEELPSGNYNLVVELRNRDGLTMLYKKVPFFRSNPGVKGPKVSDYATTFAGRYTDEAELSLYIDALYVISSDMERRAAEDVISRPGLEERQAYLYEFWSRRNAVNPEGEWLKYKERVDYVQEHFSYPMTRGIVTDRGRVYLQYGPPDFVRDEKNFSVVSSWKSNVKSTGNLTDIGNTSETAEAHDAESGLFPATGTKHAFYLPYQLWRYNMLPGNDPNRVFIFWDEFRSGYYTLLNSNARGEKQEVGWERRLSRFEIPQGEEGAVGVQFRRGY